MTRFRKISLIYSLAAIASLMLSFHANALVVVDGENNNSSPFADPGGNHVGTINNGTAIYLGNQWAVTPLHVSITTPFILNGQSYTYTSGPAIKNPDNTNADMRLVHLDQDPGLPLLNIRKTNINLLDDITFISEGVLAGDIFHEQSYSGYEWSTIREKNWGNNNVITITDIDEPINISNRYTQAFSTKFDKSPFATDFEAQAADHDSGGAAFIKNDQDQWELAGMIFAVQMGFANRATLDFDRTHSANLVFYRHKLMSAMHTPGDANRDNSVNLIDLDTLGLNFGNSSNLVWEDGDFDGDGQVTLLDLDILGTNFGLSAMTFNTDSTQSLDLPNNNTVPEPSAIIILTLTTTLAITRRKSAH